MDYANRADFNKGYADKLAQSGGIGVALESRPEIMQELEELDSMVDRVQEELGKMAGTLMPVCAAPGTVGGDLNCGRPWQNTSTQVSGRIQSVSRRLYELREMIVALHASVRI